MNKKNYNFKDPNTWQGIIITKNAATQIISLIAANINNKGIRVNIKKSGCAGLRYTMEIVQKEKKEDIIFFINNISIYIDSNHLHLINGIKIDFVKNQINKVFKFYNKKIEKFCGCGESFSVN